MSILHQGRIKNQVDLQDYQLSIKKLGPSYVAQLLDLQDSVVEALENKKIYYPLSAEELTFFGDSQGLILGAFAAAKLIGFRVITFPGRRKENLGWDVELAEEELGQVVHLEAVCIHPDYRGNSLQKLMTSLILAQLQRVGQWKHVLLTVSPDNLPSIVNTLANQLVVCKLRNMYNQTLRYIFYRNLEQRMMLNETNSLAVLLTDIERQRELLEQGYYGYKLEQRRESRFILFAREMEGN